MRLNKLLILFFFFVIVIDIFLMVILFNKNSFPTNYLFFKKNKDFIVKSNSFLFSSNPNRIKIIESGDSIFGLKEVSLYGYVNKPAYLDSKTNEIILPVRFKTGWVNVDTDLILGISNQSINSTFAKKGLIEDPLTYTIKTAKDFLSKFKRNDPIIMSFFYEQSPILLEKSEECKEKCILFINTHKKMYSNTLNLIDLLNNKNKKSNKTLKIGPPLTLITYD